MFTFCSSILNVKCLEIHFPRRGPAAGHRRASSAVSEAGGGCVVAPVGQAAVTGLPVAGQGQWPPLQLVLALGVRAR